jgi:hypothetical protein
MNAIFIDDAWLDRIDEANPQALKCDVTTFWAAIHWFGYDNAKCCRSQGYESRCCHYHTQLAEYWVSHLLSSSWRERVISKPTAHGDQQRLLVSFTLFFLDEWLLSCCSRHGPLTTHRVHEQLSTLLQTRLESRIRLPSAVDIQSLRERWYLCMWI